MKKFNVYVCEICGSTSVDKKKIEACEAQGEKEVKYPVGTKVKVKLFVEGSVFWVNGVVKKIMFRKKTHKTYYRVQLSKKETLSFANDYWPEVRIKKA